MHVIRAVNTLQRPFDRTVHGRCEQLFLACLYIVFQQRARGILLAVEREEKPFATACHAIAPIFAIISEINDFRLGAVLGEQIDHLSIGCDKIIIQNRSESHSSIEAWHFDGCNFGKTHVVLDVDFQQEGVGIFERHDIE